MSDKRITRGDVERQGIDLQALAEELGLTQPGEKWIIEPGSPTYGHKWKMHKRVNGELLPLSFTGSHGYIGATAKAAHDFLCLAWDVLYWSEQARKEKR